MSRGIARLAQRHYAPRKISRAEGYSIVQQFIELRYKRIFGADICCNYPGLLALINDNGEPLAAMGIRSGVNQFFLEQYLDAPMEDILSSRFGGEVSREEIVELGNLAGDRSSLLQLMTHAWMLLNAHEIEFVAVTATRDLRHYFRQQPFEILAEAAPGRVDNKAQWGRYYDADPQVLAARVADYEYKFAALSERRLRLQRRQRQHLYPPGRMEKSKHQVGSSLQVFYHPDYADASLSVLFSDTTSDASILRYVDPAEFAISPETHHGR